MLPQMEGWQRCRKLAEAVVGSCHRGSSQDDSRITSVIVLADAIGYRMAVLDNVLTVVDCPIKSQHLDIDDAWVD